MTGLLGLLLVCSTSANEDHTNPTVGAAGTIEQIILPGTELIGKPLVSGSPIVVRVLQAIPHGDSFRYEIRFFGMEPGKYNLADWLERKDGSSVTNLPEIPVEILSLLPPGQIQPNELETGWLPRLGGYRNVMLAAIALWTLVLFGLIFLRRKKPVAAVKTEHQATLADLLQARIESALNNQMDQSQYAELERMLFGFWRKRLGLEAEAPHAALIKIKNHADAGPLMRQLETWMHSPGAQGDHDLASLLKPFRNLPADTPGFES
jgi:hypothetical protein